MRPLRHTNRMGGTNAVHPDTFMKKMDIPEFVLFNDLPLSFLDEIGRTLGAYSVAIGYTKKGSAKSFTPIGSGVLVQKGKRFGILTAYHCLHDPGPDLRLGTVGGDQLHLILNGQSAIIPSEAVIGRAAANFPCPITSNCNKGEKKLSSGHRKSMVTVCNVLVAW